MASTSPQDLSMAERQALGAQLSAAAYSEPPMSLEGLQKATAITSWVFMALTSIVIIFRIAARLTRRFNNNPVERARGWGWDDTLAMLAYATFCLHCISNGQAAYYGVGARIARLNASRIMRSSEYLTYAIQSFITTSALIKASVIVALLRFTTQRKLRWTLYVTLIAITLSTVAAVVVPLTSCIPLAAIWNPYLGICRDPNVSINVAYVWTGVAITTDWICSLLPWFLIRDLRMSNRSKVTVMVILGLGSVASSMSVVRATYLKYLSYPPDPLYGIGYITIWEATENGTGIIAASLPALRVFFRRYLDSSRNASGSSPKRKPPLGHIAGTSLPTWHSVSQPAQPVSEGSRNVDRRGSWNRLEGGWDIAVAETWGKETQRQSGTGVELGILPECKASRSF